MIIRRGLYYCLGRVKCHTEPAGCEEFVLQVALHNYRQCVLVSDKATHPTNRQEDWEYIIGFCDQINKELEGYLFEIEPVNTFLAVVVVFFRSV